MTQVLFTAHQGGWDEVLLVAVPVGLFAALLAVANKRAGRLADQVARPAGGADGSPAGDAHAGDGAVPAGPDQDPSPDRPARGD